MNRVMQLLGIAGTGSVSTREAEPAGVPYLAFDPLGFSRTLLGFHPEPQQLPVFHATGSRGILCCNRQFGKSTTIGALALHHAWYRPQSLIVVLSPTLRQSHELLLKIVSFVRVLGIRPRTDGFNPVSLLLPNGSRIVGAPAHPDTLRGFSSVSMLLIDEAARVPDSVFDAATPMLARSGGAIWLMSTPKGRTGFFHEVWHSGDPAWTRIHSTVKDCPRISASFLESERAIKPAAVYAEEYECIFQDTGDHYFSTADVACAFSAEVLPLRNEPLRWAATKSLHYYIGLDLGKFRDHTAIVVLEQRIEATGEREAQSMAWTTRTIRQVRHIERIPLGTPYDVIIRNVGLLLAREPLAGNSTLVIDATGPGAPVVDQFRGAKLRGSIIAVSITSGGHAHYTENGVNAVPKLELISNLQIQLQNRRLQIAAGLSEVQILRRELLDMRASSRHHGDLAMALALAAWQQAKGERR